MAFIDERPERRRPWRVRWYDTSGKMRSKSFFRSDQAVRYQRVIEARLLVDQDHESVSGRKRKRVRLKDYVQPFVERPDLSAKTGSPTATS